MSFVLAGSRCALSFIRETVEIKSFTAAKSRASLSRSIGSLELIIEIDNKALGGFTPKFAS